MPKTIGKIREETGSVDRCWCCCCCCSSAAGCVPSPIFFSILHPPGGFHSTCFFIFIYLSPLSPFSGTFLPFAHLITHRARGTCRRTLYLCVRILPASYFDSLHATSTAERGRISINRQRPA